MLANTYFQNNFERCSRDNIEEGVQGKLSRSTTNLIPAYRRVDLGLCEKNRSWKHDNQYSPKRKVVAQCLHTQLFGLKHCRVLHPLIHLGLLNSANGKSIRPG